MTDDAPAKAQQDWVTGFYNSAVVVDHYRRATANLGLWRSEEALFTRTFGRDDRLLDLGTGTGRIAIGLAEQGYRYVLGVDAARNAIKEARRIAAVLELSVAFRCADARNLPFSDGLYDGAIFGFNGLMQIPGRSNRIAALREIRRVVRSGGHLIFTSHDRSLPKYRKFWRDERQRWNRGEQKPELIDFGDRWEETDLGTLFIHVPTIEEVLADLQASGWKCAWNRLRSEIAHECPKTREFSDECRFWCAVNP